MLIIPREIAIILVMAMPLLAGIALRIWLERRGAKPRLGPAVVGMLISYPICMLIFPHFADKWGRVASGALLISIAISLSLGAWLLCAIMHSLPAWGSLACSIGLLLLNVTTIPLVNVLGGCDLSYGWGVSDTSKDREEAILFPIVAKCSFPAGFLTAESPIIASLPKADREALIHSWPIARTFARWHTPITGIYLIRHPRLWYLGKDAKPGAALEWRDVPEAEWNIKGLIMYAQEDYKPLPPIPATR